jgi:hypothetical protein
VAAAVSPMAATSVSFDLWAGGCARAGWGVIGAGAPSAPLGGGVVMLPGGGWHEGQRGEVVIQYPQRPFIAELSQWTTPRLVLSMNYCW